MRFYIPLLEMPNTRRNRRGGGLFGKLYGPIHEALGLGGNVVSTVTNTTRNVARRGLNGVNTVGKSVTGRANSAISSLISRKRRGGRRGSRRGNRKSNRKSSRRNRRN